MDFLLSFLGVVSVRKNGRTQHLFIQVVAAGKKWSQEKKSSSLFSRGKSLIYTLELSQKSDFQSSTTKPDNRGHPSVQTGQI